jgi:hypothetical protein
MASASINPASSTSTTGVVVGIPTKAGAGGAESLPKEMQDMKIKDNKIDHSDDKVFDVTSIGYNPYFSWLPPYIWSNALSQYFLQELPVNRMGLGFQLVLSVGLGLNFELVDCMPLFVPFLVQTSFCMCSSLCWRRSTKLFCIYAWPCLMLRLVHEFFICWVSLLHY